MAHYNLQRLIDYFNISLDEDELDTQNKGHIQHLRIDSRLVESDDLFIALKGHTVDGCQFIPQSIEAGAIAVLVETDNCQQHRQVDYYSFQHRKIPLFYIFELSKQLSAFANHFYDYPSEKMQVIGITGTNGKTTISHLVAQWATLLNYKSAMLGTLGNGIYNQLEPSVNTTSSPVEIQSYLADFYKQNVKLVAMEVSSHGLVQNRVKDITFAASLFTNLSRDHLDFHNTMQAYQQAKWSLFTPNKAESAVKSAGKRIINFDDHVGQQWITMLDEVIVVSAKPENLAEIKTLKQPYVGVSHLTYHDKGVNISLESSYGSAQFNSSLYGAFNVSNLLLAFSALIALDYSFDDLIKTAEQLLPVCGRMEIFSAPDKATVVIDYAHTPDALDKALAAVKDHCHGALWVIFGCGGDRDKGKRPLMAKIAEYYSDHVIVANDNPRTEDQDAIIADIHQGFIQPDKTVVIKDRQQAIHYAIAHSNTNDIIVVAGKGHEDYQIIGKQKHHYSDRETVCQILGIAL